MQIIFLWINICVCFILAWASGGLKNLTENELKEMKRKWIQCCKTNVCIQNSCYTTEWKASGWYAVRQRCQGRYPDWPFAVDIFRIQNQDDIETLSKMLHKVPENSEGNPSTPRAVWTSGSRCPKMGAEGPVLVKRWTSTNASFPDWLGDKIDASSDMPEENEGCKFLVIYPSPNKTDVKYDFEDQSARHAAVCEFLFTGDLDNSTQESSSETPEFLNTTDAVTDASSTSSTTSLDTTTKTAIKSKTLKPAKDSLTTSTKSLTTKPSSESSTAATTNSPDPGQKEDHTTRINRFCEGKTVAGIDWPDAEPGVTVNKSCPDGMTGYAQWKCSESTYKYIPTRPHIQDCKHIWIKHLEEEVDKGGDAVFISHKLKDETQNQNLSHGDITALVDLSSKILRLYAEQNEDELVQVTGDQFKPLSYNFTGSMVSSISNILRAEIKTAWEVLPEIHQTRAASKILKLVTIMGSRLSCVRKSSDKLQFTVTAENIGLQTFILNNSESQDEDSIVFPQKVLGVEANSSLSLPTNLELSNWYSSCKNFKTAVGVIYNHVGDFLKDENLPGSTAHVVTKVISFSISNKTESISLPRGKEVTVVLQHTLQRDILRGKLKNPKCVFWNFSKQTYGQWDSSGCHRRFSNLTHTVCTCDHLTNFAVLMDVNNNIKEDEVQSIMTYVCCGVSSLTLLLTLICFLTIRSLHGRRSIITGNLCFCLLITNLLILFGLDQTQSRVLCATVAGLLHFWILSAFFWMLVEGYHLYKMVILVFQRGSNLSVKFYYLFAYGSPLTIVGVSAAVKTDYYGGENYCWLSSNQGFMWSFVGPACAVILVNIVIFILTLRSASTVRIKREQTTLKKIKSWARGSLSVMCLLGLTWCLGLFYIDQKLHIFSYIFILLNGLQGVFIFIFHVLLNERVKAVCFKKWTGKNQDRWKKFTTQTSSNRLQSKTSTHASVHSNGCAASTMPQYLNASALNSRRMSDENNAAQSLNQLKKNRNILMDASINNVAARSRNINYNKRKATHTLSENGPQGLSVSEPYKIRSQSIADEGKNLFHRNTSCMNRPNNFTKPNKITPT